MGATLLQPFRWASGPAAIVAATFTEADTTSSTATADTGQAFVSRGAAVWGVSGNQAYPSNGAGAEGIKWVNAGVSDCTFECVVKYAHAGDGVVFRGLGAANNDGFLVYLDGSALVALVPGFGAHLTGSPMPATHTVGVTYRIKVVLLGSSIDIYEDGVLKMSTSSATQQTATHFGLRAGSRGANGRWDNLLVTD